MILKIMKPGDKLQSCMLDLEVGDTLDVPYKLYSAGVIRTTASQLKYDKGIVFEVNTRGEKCAKVTRVQ